MKYTEYKIISMTKKKKINPGLLSQLKTTSDKFYKKLTKEDVDKFLLDIMNAPPTPKTYSLQWGKYIVTGTNYEQVYAEWLDLMKQDNPEWYEKFLNNVKQDIKQI